MKELKLTVKRQKTEGLIFGCCFLMAFLMNVLSIVLYDTQWKELYTQLCWVLAISLFLYFLIGAFRLLYRCVRRLVSSKKQENGKKQ